ncbi:hypothetical protein EBS02_03445 [bacterium]|jgi:hypothetical protein|nr:hypothetical protein [bacterium]
MKDLLVFFGKAKDKLFWVCRELVYMYSPKKSFFSKKRIESSLAFIIGQWGMIFWLLEKHSELSSSDIAIWSGIEFAIAGYIMTEIQKEKKEDLRNDDNFEDPSTNS